jgi:hypothetical protein
VQNHVVLGKQAATLWQCRVQLLPFHAAYYAINHRTRVSVAAKIL